jgi:hypothetical protein
MIGGELQIEPSELLPDSPELQKIPAKHRESLIKTQRIASEVGTELPVYEVQSPDAIEQIPGAYLFSNYVDTSSYDNIIATKFDLDIDVLSGKANSAHAVLPGMLGILYSENGVMSERRLPVAVKGFYKREFPDRFDRVQTEITASHIQSSLGELAFEPVAVVVAPPEYKGKTTVHNDYDLLLVSKLDESVKTLDNAPWQLGFTEANILAAEAAVTALGRFNASVGRHKDAKIMNVAQRPDGTTSMIDFETSQSMDRTNPSNAASVVHEDLSTLLDSLDKRGFFAQEKSKARAVLDNLGAAYLESWAGAQSSVQEAVYGTIVLVIEECINSYVKPH